MKNSIQLFKIFVPALIILLSCNKALDVIPEETQVVQLLTYTKTPCFGFCDAYSVTLLSDNSICIQELGPAKDILRDLEANEAMRVETENRIHKEIKVCKVVKPDFWKNIKDKAIQLNIHKLKKFKFPDLDFEVVDISKTVIKIKIGEKLIEIEDSMEAPKELDEFETYVENMLDEVRGKSHNKS